MGDIVVWAINEGVERFLFDGAKVSNKQFCLRGFVAYLATLLLSGLITYVPLKLNRDAQDDISYISALSMIVTVDFAACLLALSFLLMWCYRDHCCCCNLVCCLDPTMCVARKFFGVRRGRIPDYRWDSSFDAASDRFSFLLFLRLKLPSVVLNLMTVISIIQTQQYRKNGSALDISVVLLISLLLLDSLFDTAELFGATLRLLKHTALQRDKEEDLYAVEVDDNQDEGDPHQHEHEELLPTCTTSTIIVGDAVVH
eukprot:TRINITY_DN18508_c0_g1_i1.p1 TRINITY_DN18508_c0_g1~~TRINITY_DN18508_c0_g1_i1.p1  ORF type:complete len:256 (-),score=62.88 TRINITY_DN18508_c0_g1_i1:79-846(-)